eukprot:9429243-Ditylum_brightwellii.AAC.1
MEKVQVLTTAGANTYTDAQLISIAFDLVFSSGIHSNACKEWPRKPCPNQTLTSFKHHFTEAHCLLHEMQTFVVQEGYTANFAYEEDSSNTQAAEVLAKLAVATTNDRAAVADLTATNTNLMGQVANMTTKVSITYNEIVVLRLSIDQLN